MNWVEMGGRLKEEKNMTDYNLHQNNNTRQVQTKSMA